MYSHKKRESVQKEKITKQQKLSTTPQLRERERERDNLVNNTTSICTLYTHQSEWLFVKRRFLRLKLG